MGKTVNDYLADVCQDPSVPGVYAFRGQGDSSWSLRSGAARRLLGHYGFDDESRVPSFSRIYLEYHQNVLIDPARTRGFGLDNGRTLADLEILAKLQHFGAATGLLDFTYSPLIALWFACQNKECDGKVFCIDTVDPLAFGRLGYQMVMEEDVSKLLSHDRDDSRGPDGDDFRPWIWEPIATGEAETRVLVQNSLFVIGRPSIAEGAARGVVIGKEDKEQLRRELETTYAIREESLFKDVYGFSSVNQASDPVPTFEHPESYFLSGNRKYQEGYYQEAIENYDQVIRLQPELAEAYNNRGNAKGMLGRYEEAIADFDRALHHSPANANTYINRGNAKGSLGRHDDAISDYDQAIHLDANDIEAYYNRGNSKGALGRFDDALADYDVDISMQLPIMIRPFASSGTMPRLITVVALLRLTYVILQGHDATLRPHWL